MAGKLRIIGRDRHGMLPHGMAIVEGPRELGQTGDWLLLAPRTYVICVRLRDGTLTPPHRVEVRDLAERTIEIIVDAPPS